MYPNLTPETRLGERPYPYGPAEPPMRVDDDLNYEYIQWQAHAASGRWPEFKPLPCEEVSADHHGASDPAHGDRGNSASHLTPCDGPAKPREPSRPRARRRKVDRDRQRRLARAEGEALGVAGQRVLEVAGVFGVMSLAVLAQIAAARAGIRVDRCYRAVQHLASVGQLAVRTPREAGGFEPCPGLLYVVAITPAGLEACRARGIRLRAGAAAFTTQRAAGDQLVLSAHLLLKVATRWALENGPGAVLRLAKYQSAPERRPFGRGARVLDAEYHRLLTLSPGLRFAALLPPEPGDIAAVLFGGAWTDGTCFDAPADRHALSTALPYSIVCSPRGAAHMRKLRRAGRGWPRAFHERAYGTVAIAPLPEPRGQAWRALWTELSTLVTLQPPKGKRPDDAAAAAVERIVGLIDRLLPPS